MPTTKLSVDITARLDEFEKNLAKTPGITKREIKKAVKEMKAELIEAEKAAGIAAKKAEKAWDEAFGKIGGVGERTMGLLGGAFGDAADVIFDVIGPLKEASGGLTGAGAAAAGAAAGATAVVLAWGAAAAAATSLANGALEARDRLTELGLEIDSEAQTDLASYAAATRDLGVAMDRLRVAIGSDIAGELALVARTVAGGVTWAAEYTDEIAGLAGGMASSLLPASVQVAGQLAGPLYDALTDGARAAAETEGKLSELEGTFQTFGPSLDDLATANERYAESQRKAAEATREAAEATREAADERAKLLAGNEKELSDLEESRKKRAEIANAEVKELGRQRELREALEELAEAQAAIDTAVAQSIASTEAYAGSWTQVVDVIESVGPAALAVGQVAAGMASDILDAVQSTADATIAAMEEQAQVEQDAAKQSAEDWGDAEKQIIDAMLARGDISEKEANDERDRIDRTVAAKINASKHLSDEEKEIAMDAFRRSQTSARAQAIIQAAVVGIGVTAQLAPLIGPFALIPGAAAAGTSLGIAFDAINNAPAPEFPTGILPAASSSASPDHPRSVRLQDEEAALSIRGVAGAGGRAGVARLNAGQGAAPPVTQIYISRRLLAEIVGATSPSRPVDPRAGRTGRRR